MNNRHKVTIELSAAEYQGIKQYLKDVCEVNRPGKKDVSQFITGELNGLLWMNTAVSDYVLNAHSAILQSRGIEKQ